VAYWRKIEMQRLSLRTSSQLPSLCQDEQTAVLLPIDVLSILLSSSQGVCHFSPSPVLPLGINMLAICTRTIDDWLFQADESRPRQVVDLGAGMCTRPSINCHGLAMRQQLSLKWMIVTYCRPNTVCSTKRVTFCESQW
jgi:hypothetical protein